MQWCIIISGTSCAATRTATSSPVWFVARGSCTLRLLFLWSFGPNHIPLPTLESSSPFCLLEPSVYTTVTGSSPARVLVLLDGRRLLPSSLGAVKNCHRFRLKDLHEYVGRLAPELNFELGGPLTAASVADFKRLFVRNLQTSLKKLASESDRLPLINARFRRNGPSASTFSMRPYLTATVSEDVRKSFCRLMAGDHPLAVEALRRMPANQKIRSMGGIVSGNYLRDTSSHFAVCAPHQAILSFARHIKPARAVLRRS